jgi:hypothetical protein
MKLRIVAPDDTPIAGVVVLRGWKHYSLQSESKEEVSRTDQYGVVHFRRINVWAGIWRRIYGAASSFLETGLHASYGPSASARAFAPGFRVWQMDVLDDLKIEKVHYFEKTIYMQPDASAQMPSWLNY